VATSEAARSRTAAELKVEAKVCAHGEGRQTSEPRMKLRKVPTGIGVPIGTQREPAMVDEGRGPRCCGLCLILRRDFNSQSPQG
jgi:hypothetical protein